MVIVKSIGFGILSVIIGQILGIILSLIVGLIAEPVAEKFLSGLTLKKCRYLWSYIWIGATIGMINALSNFLWGMSTITLSVVFVLYLLFFAVKNNQEYVFTNLCNGETLSLENFLKYLRRITFISYCAALYGSLTILIKFG